MIQARPLLGLGAFLALAAWANAQVMACCWFPESAETSASRISAPMAEDHACCPGEGAEATPPEKDSSSRQTCGGTAMQADPALCCAHDLSPAEIPASASQSSFAALLFVAATGSNPAQGASPIPGRVRPTLYASSGPPRYLSLQRILI
ncbi:MAG: hypothetical protein K0Q91_1862 [Fibrobacteria bacterium]|jgi:hypothetical protein|nr:hypothetical protein [Fibrobacteria bacterium]